MQKSIACWDSPEEECIFESINLELKVLKLFAVTMCCLLAARYRIRVQQKKSSSLVILYNVDML